MGFARLKVSMSFSPINQPFKLCILGFTNGFISGVKSMTGQIYVLSNRNFGPSRRGQ